MTKKPQVVIVTEAGSSIGYGHLARCQSLCQAFQESGIEPILVLDGDAAASGFCSGQTVREVPWHQEPGALRGVIAGAEMVIVDSLLGPEAVFELIESDAKVPVFLDDFVRRSYRRGIVIDWTVLAESRFYLDRGVGVTHLLGSRFAALRRPFWDATTRPVASTVGNVLVTFGGSDPADMTPRVLRLLNRLGGGFQVRTVIGPGFRNTDAIAAELRQNHSVIHAPDAEQMVQLMQRADLAIATGGQTLYELARMGVPTVGVMVVENQRDDISGWQDTGFLHLAGKAADADLEQSLAACLERLQRYDGRLLSSQEGQRAIDGNGARRVVAALREAL